MARTGVTFDDISQAATKLLSMGESPSVQKVRELLGTGSNSTIAEHLKRWKLQRSTKEGVTLPEAIPKELIPPLETLWHIAIEHSDHRYLKFKSYTQQQIETLTTERDTWKEQAQTIEIELSETQEILKNAQCQLSEVQLTLKEQQSLSNQLQIVIEKNKDDNENLKLQLSQQKQDADDKKRNLIAEHQREIKTYQQQRDELRENINKEQQRSDASEARWLRIIDQTKDEVKALQKKLTASENDSRKHLQESELKIRVTNDRVIELEKELFQKQVTLDQQKQHIHHLNQTISHLEANLNRSEQRLESWYKHLSSEKQKEPTN